jgi:alpha-glucosidase (family GH31 glycosyl hydrolase)
MAPTPPFDPKPQAHPSNVITSPGAQYRFTLLTPRLLRFEYSPTPDQFEDRPSTFALHRGAFEPVSYRLKDNSGTSGGFEIITDYMHVDYDGKQFSSSGLLVDIKSRTTLHGPQWRYGTEATVGGRDNLGGTARTLDEVDGRCEVGVGVCSRLGYAVIDDSGSMVFDLANHWIAGRKGKADGYVDGYLFAYGHDYRAAVKDFYRLSGSQPVVPRWALGNWWSRYYRYSDKEYLALMDEFKRRELPLSVAVIDMDWHYTYDERVPHAGWTGYTWDESIFPDPEGFGREIHARKLKMSLNDHPHSGVHHHEKSYEEMARVLGHVTKDKDPILFDPTSKPFMDAYHSVLHRELERQGCDMWWLDWQSGSVSKVPGVDPLWVLNHTTFEANRDISALPMIFSRYAGPGSHRYPVGFSGDTITTWDSLAFQPEFTATASNIGYGWWSNDLGGHMFGSRDDELVTRWIQLGVLSPVTRLHSTNSKWMGKEPWMYRKESEVIIEHWMRFRHRL